MKKYFVDLSQTPAELKKGLIQLTSEYPVTLKKQPGCTELTFIKNTGLKNTGELCIKQIQNGILVNYKRKIDALRALGHLFGQLYTNNEENKYTEQSNFEMLGAMLECSRNGVLTVDNVKAFIRRLSLMGVNTLMLYTEDTYEVPGEPFFGYLRGKYTQKELKELDNYADNLGIEMFPCIQTLAHLAQVLQWQDTYRDISQDWLNSYILLAGEEKTYKFIEKIVSAASAPFKSKKIHIGMDEAWALGQGKYLEKHGKVSKTEIMKQHLKKVITICKKKNLKPMMWGDMFVYHRNKNVKVTKDMINAIPKEVELIYWDYYRTDKENYNQFIKLYRQLKKEPIIAPGAWNWNYFWSDLKFAYATIGPCMTAAREKNLTKAFITTWGDDGMENDIYSALPAIQYFAEHGYNNKPGKQLLKTNFYGSCLGNIEKYELANLLDDKFYIKKYFPEETNPSKWLLWDDPLIGLCEPHQEGMSFKKHYQELSLKLQKEIKGDVYSKRLVFPCQIAKVLALKCDIRKNIVKAYKSGNKKGIKQLISNELNPLITETRKLWKVHRTVWLSTYKPFGLEVIEIRYGGLINRLESLKDRLNDYISGDVKTIPEFETKLLKFHKTSKKYLLHVNTYKRVATPSAMF
ncbi:MAG: hypothetical protein A2252_05730 [Elusimicrobia bacterium RIFOXYA2_FULL_39_19]|nr:MAG: hypothetical protein A2252_05730 [Elusimicrobia bacterium RIFOXYA2_FULL_39_19]